MHPYTRTFVAATLFAALVCGATAAATLSGKVTYPDGTPAWFGVSVTDSNGKAHVPANHVPVHRTGIDQRFWFRFGGYELELEGGEYTVRAEPYQGWACEPQTVVIKDGDDVSLDLTATRQEEVEHPTIIRIRVRENGQPAAARLTVTTENAKGEVEPLVPQGVLGHTWRQKHHWYPVWEGCEVLVPDDATNPVRIYVVRGTEYEFVDKTIKPERGKRTDVVIDLDRWIDLAAEGWYSGDVHTHILGATGFPGHPTPPERFPGHALRLMDAEDLKLGCWLLCPGPSSTIIDRGFYEDGPYRMKIDQEPRNSTYGHMVSLLMDRAVAQYNSGREFNGHDYPSNLPLIKDLRAAGGVVGYAHPIAGKYEILNQVPGLGKAPGVNNTAICRGFPSDVVHEKLSFLEVYSWSATEDANEQLWYHLMNCGFDVMPAAGTDAFNGAHPMSAPAGGLRAYCRVDGELTYRKWVEALAQGKTFLTSGPALTLTVDGRAAGGTIERGDGGTLNASVRLRSNLPVDVIDVLVGGEVAHSFDVGDQWREFSASCPVDVTESSYVTARARGNQNQPELIEEEVRALTGPVFVNIGGQPRSSADSARFFIRWINEFKDVLEKDGVFARPGEKAEVFAELDSALAFYRKMASSR